MTKWLTWLAAFLGAVVLVVAIVGPIGPMPGIWLGGQTAPPPVQWSAVNLPHTVQLKTSGGLLPRVVNLWVVESANDLYLFGESESGWVRSTLKAPDVALRIEDSVYALRAQATEDVAAAYAAYIERYEADYPEIVENMPALSEITGAGVGFRLVRP